MERECGAATGCTVRPHSGTHPGSAFSHPLFSGAWDGPLRLGGGLLRYRWGAGSRWGGGHLAAEWEWAGSPHPPTTACERWCAPPSSLESRREDPEPN
eukprot:gene20702-biopygen22136